MSNLFNLTGDHRVYAEKKEQAFIPFDAPDVITPTKFTSSQNTLRRRTMTGADMVNSQPIPSTSNQNLKRQRMDNVDLLNSSPHKEPRIQGYSQESPERFPPRDSMHISQQQYRSYPREEFNIYDHQLSSTELIEKNRMLQTRLDNMMRRFKELSDVRYTEAEEIAYKFRLNEGYRDEAYAHIEKAVEELQLLKGSGNEGHKILVEKLQEENQSLKEQLREQIHKKGQNNESNISEIHNILALYEGLTNLKVANVKRMKDGELYECVTNGKVATHKFTLFMPTDTSKLIEYTPTSENTQTLSSILPDFLLEDIDFSKDNLPLFFWRLSSSLNPKS